MTPPRQPGRLHAVASGSAGARRLIFLCGLPRSGTTWLGKILDSHPETLYLHEPDSLHRIEGLPAVPDIAAAESYRAAIERYIDLLPTRRSTKVVSSLPLFPKRYCSGYRFALERVAVLGAKTIGRVAGEVTVPSVGSDRGRRDAPIVWKSIESTLAMGTIMKVAAAWARGVLILRHPCGYVASVLHGESRGRFSSSVAAAEDFGIYAHLTRTDGARDRGLSLDRFEAMTPVERLAWRWVLTNEQALEQIRVLDHCTTFVYEDLCQSPVEQAKMLFGFVGLGWNAQSEGFVRRSTAVDRSEYYSVFKDPLRSASKWREQLAAADVGRIMRIAEQSAVGRLYLEAANAGDFGWPNKAA